MSVKIVGSTCLTHTSSCKMQQNGILIRGPNCAASSISKAMKSKSASLCDVVVLQNWHSDVDSKLL